MNTSAHHLGVECSFVRVLAALLVVLAASVYAVAPMPGPRAGEKILVLSPHPDDETLCCGGYLQAAVANGASVYIVWVTNGDAYQRAVVAKLGVVFPGPASYRRLGRMRMSEAVRAARKLGVPAGHLFFLGFPDGGLAGLFDEYYVHPYRSPRTGLAAAQYDGVYEAAAPYTGMELERLLTRLIKEIRPDRILLPALQDSHEDHKAVAIFGTSAALRSGYGARLCRWIVHSGWNWPSPMRLEADGWLGDPPTGEGMVWRSYRLRDAQIEHKLAAVLEYHSQLAVMKDFLEAFIRQNELFACSNVR